MSTDIHTVRDLALKGFGLYCLFIVVNMVLSQFVITFQLLSDGMGVAIAGSFLVLLAYAALGYVCLFRTRAVRRLLWRNAEPATAVPRSALAAVIALMGVYFAIRSAGSVAYYAWLFRHPTLSGAGLLTGSIIALAFAIWLVLRPAVIAECVLRRGITSVSPR